MADGVTQTCYEIVLSHRGTPAPDFLDRIVARLTEIDGAKVIEARQIEALGMTAKDAFFTVMLGLPTSILANFATDAIRAAMEDAEGAVHVQIDDIAVVTDLPNPLDLPSVQVTAPVRRRDEGN